MTTTTTYHSTVNSWGALALAAVCTTATAFVLLEDVFRHLAPITTGHISTAVALVVTIAAGHWFWPQLRQMHLLSAFALAILFFGGTAYIVTTSAGRNATLATQKLVSLASKNDLRKSVEADLAAAKADVVASRKAAADECGTGRRVRCDGRIATRDADMARADALAARLATLDPPSTDAGAYRHAALTLSAVGLGDPDVIEDRLALGAPFVLALILEVGAIVFFAIAVGATRRQTVSVVPLTVSAPTAITERQEPITDDELDDLRKIYRPNNKTVRSEPPADTWILPETNRSGAWTRGEAQADLVTIIGLNNGRVPAQTVLVDRWGVAKSTVSTWCTVWEATGLIQRERAGRCKTVELVAA